MRRTSWADPPVPPPSPRPGRRRAKVVCPLSSLVRVACLYLLLVPAHAASFSVVQGGGWSLLPLSLPLAAVLGALLGLFNRGVSLARQRLLVQMRPVMVGFLLFFVYIVGYTVLFSMVVSVPLEWWLRVRLGAPSLARAYVPFAANFIIVLAILSWLRWLLGAAGMLPWVGLKEGHGKA